MERPNWVNGKKPEKMTKIEILIWFICLSMITAVTVLIHIYLVLPLKS